jgi:phage tail-like protein
MAEPRPYRAYSAAHFGLELDNRKKNVGFFRSIEGGGINAEVITTQFGDNYDVWRQLGKPKYEDFKIQTGMSMSLEYYAWIKQFFQGVVVRKSGAIIACDFRWCEQARREFTDAIITEIAVPKLDAADKGAAYMTVTIAPEKMEFKRGSREQVKWDEDVSGQQLWTASNFAFTIDGFDDCLTRVTKIDGFSIKQKPIEYHYGEQRAPLKIPGRIEWPSITFYVPEVDSAPLIEDYVKQSVTGEPLSPGRTASIVVKDNAGSDLFTVTLKGCHLKSAAPEKNDSQSEEIKQVKFEMAVESMDFDWAMEPV